MKLRQAIKIVNADRRYRGSTRSKAYKVRDRHWFDPRFPMQNFTTATADNMTCPTVKEMLAIMEHCREVLGAPEPKMVDILYASQYAISPLHEIPISKAVWPTENQPKGTR